MTETLFTEPPTHSRRHEWMLLCLMDRSKAMCVFSRNHLIIAIDGPAASADGIARVLPVPDKAPDCGTVWLADVCQYWKSVAQRKGTRSAGELVACSAPVDLPC